MALTPKQTAFIDEWCIDMNATASAIRSGYSPKSAEKIGRDLLRNPKVAEEIERRLAERSKTCGISAQRVLDQLSKIVFTQIDDILDPVTGDLKPGIDTSIITEYKKSWNKGVILKLDRLKALEMLVKHLGLIDNKVNVNLTGNIVNIIDDIPNTIDTIQAIEESDDND